MPTILFVTPTLVSYQVFLRQLAERLIQQDWQVHVACSSRNYPGEHASADVATIHEVDLPRGINVLTYARAAVQIRKLVPVIRPDIIHAHLQPAVLAVALAKRTDWPITLGTFQGLVHTTLPQGPRRWLYAQVERWASRRLHCIWLLTKDDLQAMPLLNVKLQSAPGFGADQSVFDPRRFSEADRRDQRAELGIPEAATVFVYVGRQTFFKGFPETAQAALKVVSQRDDVHFILVGTGDPRHADGLTPDQRRRLLSHAQIHVIGWSDDVGRLLHASDCFVFPSAREGMAVCIMESLSMGKPVVTTPARGCRELVQDGHNGWIVQKDAAKLARTLLEICQHPDQRKQRAATALAERAKFSRERFNDEQLEIYQRVLSEKTMTP